jgi:hypothetical protein
MAMSGPRAENAQGFLARAAQGQKRKGRSRAQERRVHSRQRHGSGKGACVMCGIGMRDSASIGALEDSQDQHQQQPKNLYLLKSLPPANSHSDTGGEKAPGGRDYFYPTYCLPSIIGLPHSPFLAGLPPPAPHPTKEWLPGDWEGPTSGTTLSPVGAGRGKS